jgi:predicted DsbA family dithiol-disulfide isomerase
VARKTKAPPKGKRYPLNMRTTLELRQKIEGAAKLSGRSLVQEVEYRLEQSFEREGLRQNFSALMREHADYTAKVAAEAAAEKVMERLRKLQELGIDPAAPPPAKATKPDQE